MKCERLTFYMFFFFNDTATTEIYTLSLHDALPIFAALIYVAVPREDRYCLPNTRFLLHQPAGGAGGSARDRKSTRLNSSHLVISYAVFCLKKKKQTTT